MPRNRSTRSRVLLAVVLVALVAAPIVYAAQPPSADQIAFAQRVSDLLLNEMFAALLQEFGETTPENVEEGKQAISLIFADHNRSIRLIGTIRPLLGGNNNLPSDQFEKEALSQALLGQAGTAVEQIDDRWYYRRSVPLSNFHPSCVMCHARFGPTNPEQWVGALVLRVPIGKD